MPALRSLDDLDRRLAREAPPLILVHSDTHLLREEGGRRVRDAALADPEVERRVFRAEEKLDFDAIRRELAAPSLFAPRRLVEVHFGDAAPGKEGTGWLAEYAADPAPDVWLLVTLGYQSKKTQGTKWFRAVDGAGVTLALFAPRRHELPGWLAARLRGHGLEPTRDAVALLAERVEGNLEAAAAEVEKLALHAGGQGGTLDVEGVLAAVGDQARFSVFDLSEAALAREPGRAVRVLGVLRAEGAELPPLIGALAWDVRNLISLRARLARGEDAESACRALRVLPPRKAVMVARARDLPVGVAEDVLVALARADRLAKGTERGDAWAAVADAVLALAGAPITPPPATEAL